jgi:hypothetical protein
MKNSQNWKKPNDIWIWGFNLLSNHEINSYNQIEHHSLTRMYRLLSSQAHKNKGDPNDEKPKQANSTSFDRCGFPFGLSPKQDFPFSPGWRR